MTGKFDSSLIWRSSLQIAFKKIWWILIWWTDSKWQSFRRIFSRRCHFFNVDDYTVSLWVVSRYWIASSRLQYPSRKHSCIRPSHLQGHLDAVCRQNHMAKHYPVKERKIIQLPHMRQQSITKNYRCIVIGHIPRRISDTCFFKVSGKLTLMDINLTVGMQNVKPSN